MSGLLPWWKRFPRNECDCSDLLESADLSESDEFFFIPKKDFALSSTEGLGAAGLTIGEAAGFFASVLEVAAGRLVWLAVEGC